MLVRFVVKIDPWNKAPAVPAPKDRSGRFPPGVYWICRVPLPLPLVKMPPLPGFCVQVKRVGLPRAVE